MNPRRTSIANATKLALCAELAIIKADGYGGSDRLDTAASIHSHLEELCFYADKAEWAAEAEDDAKPGVSDSREPRYWDEDENFEVDEAAHAADMEIAIYAAYAYEVAKIAHDGLALGVAWSLYEAIAAIACEAVNWRASRAANNARRIGLMADAVRDRLSARSAAHYAGACVPGDLKQPRP